MRNEGLIRHTWYRIEHRLHFRWYERHGWRSHHTHCTCQGTGVFR